MSTTQPTAEQIREMIADLTEQLKAAEATEKAAREAADKAHEETVEQFLAAIQEANDLIQTAKDALLRLGYRGPFALRARKPKAELEPSAPEPSGESDGAAAHTPLHSPGIVIDC